MIIVEPVNTKSKPDFIGQSKIAGKNAKLACKSDKARKTVNTYSIDNSSVLLKSGN